MAWRTSRQVAVLAVILAPVLVAGCGSILGIDDGIPLDASAEGVGSDGSSGSGSGSSSGSSNSSGGDETSSSSSGGSSSGASSGSGSSSGIEDAPSDMGPSDATTDGGPCTPGVRGCNGNSIAFCQLTDAGPQWVNIMQCTALCSQGQCTECAPGTVQCMGLQPQTCDQSGTWQDVGSACPFLCDSATGKCSGMCTPNTTQCADGTHTETCDSTGTWSVTACTGSVCAGAGVCGTCMPGATMCTGSSGYVTCDQTGNWGTVQTACVNGQTCTNGACTGGSCISGQTRCQGNSVQTCTGSTWGAPMPCTNKTCVNGACTGVCAPGQTQCDASNNTVQTCDSSGNWVDSTPCSMGGETCVSGACTGVCIAGTHSCQGNTPETCSSTGQWTLGASCTNQTCVGGTCSGVCAPGQSRCDPSGNNYLQYCDGNGQWQDGSPCQYVCVAGQTQCSGVCTPGSIQCNAGTPQLCDSTGQWGGCGSNAQCQNACMDAGVCGAGAPCTALSCCNGTYCLDNGSGGGNCGNSSSCGGTCCGQFSSCTGSFQCCFPMVCISSGGGVIGDPFAGGSGSSGGIQMPDVSSGGGQCDYPGGGG